MLSHDTTTVQRYRANPMVSATISIRNALSAATRRTRKKRKTKPPSSAFPCALLSLNSQNLTTVVGTASLAGSVGHYGLTALGANRNAGSGKLPVGATALIAAGLGHFTLGDSHGDTSLVKLLFTAFIMDLLLKKLLQSSKSGIELLLAIAGTIVEVFAAAVAEPLAIGLAQQLGIQIQD